MQKKNKWIILIPISCTLAGLLLVLALGIFITYAYLIISKNDPIISDNQVHTAYYGTYTEGLLFRKYTCADGFIKYQPVFANDYLCKEAFAFTNGKYTNNLGATITSEEYELLYNASKKQAELEYLQIAPSYQPTTEEIETLTQILMSIPNLTQEEIDFRIQQVKDQTHHNYYVIEGKIDPEFNAYITEKVDIETGIQTKEQYCRIGELAHTYLHIPYQNETCVITKDTCQYVFYTDANLNQKYLNDCQTLLTGKSGNNQ